MKRLIVVLSMFTLLGAGCSVSTNEYPDTTNMTPEQLQRAMDEEMRVNPPQYLPEIEMAMEDDFALMLKREEKMRSGTFREKAHAGQGTATITRKDGKTYLVLDAAFKTDAGPRLHVFLAGHPDPGSSTDLHSMGDLDLGALKSPSGGQVYEIPDDKADEDWRSVVVYCVPFKVVFTAASLN
ncbi:hypothetical protein EPO33_00660 [Patescibacteria group bacterium]|nr:MAG: hypothetical protein EPO33_00660 [Patescibacteria group bacterium]